jgi:hypothetical protein
VIPMGLLAEGPRRPGVAFAYQSVLAWSVALLVVQGGRLLGLGG